MKIRLHLLGIPHTITKDEYSHCAFTGKVQRFSPMMQSLGYEVYHYGNETSESGANVQIDILSLEELNSLKKISCKILFPNLSDEEVNNKLSDSKQFIGDLANMSSPLYKEFNKKLREKLIQNYRSTSTDIVCLPFGPAHEDAIRNLNYVYVESGIGYPNAYKNFRIYESYSKLHYDYSRCQKRLENYWFVCPNYYDLSEWVFNENPIKNRIGFFGRICDIKGIYIIVELARRFPNVEFIVCGQGNLSSYDGPSNLIYQEPLHGRDRYKYLNSLTALLAPSKFLEPFCGVSAEAQLCGTPVITHDYGALVENIEQFKTGLRCHTLSDFCYGVQMAIDGRFNRKYIHERAVELFDMYKIAKKYDYAFKSILDIYNGTNGWYSNNVHIDVLDNDKNMFNKHIDNKIKWFYFYTPDYEIWHKQLYNSLSQKFDVNPIIVNEIPKLNDQHKRHHFTGCSFKLELLINTIKNNMGERIVFTDATWYINPNKVDELYELMKKSFYGMNFCNNSGDGNLNIGIICLDCNEKNLLFWEHILNEFNKDPQNSHDQRLVEANIKNPNLYDPNKIVARWPVSKDIWKEKYEKSFLMLKIFTSSSANKEERDNFRYKIMNDYGYL